MKKLLLSALAVAMTMGVSAQRWDFTNWSDETVANLKACSALGADATEWSDGEKSNTGQTDASKDNCFWEVTLQGTTDGATLMANGAPIKELQGLLFTHTKARALAIAVNYPTTSIGTYNGPSYLWLGSSKINYFVIPNVKPGTEISIGLESHKSIDARGVELYVGRGNTGTKLLDPDGNAVAVPTTYEDQVFYLPEGLEDAANEDGTYDITVYNTNGCHLYYIQVGDGSGEVEEPNKIAYLYADKEGYDVETDPIYGILSSTDNTLEAINITNFTAADTDTINALETNYDLLIVSETPASGHAFASSLKGMVNRVPMLNMKSFFYKSNVWGWGAGENPKPSTGTITLTEAGAAHPAFATLGYEVGSEIELYGVSDENYAGNIIQGYTASEGGFIADDAVLATAGGFSAIHEHGSSNKYMLYPLSSDAIVSGVEFADDATNLLIAIVDYLAATKSKVRQATKPTITPTYENNLTTVEITTTIAGATIYYTIDGTEPTSASPVYSEPLTFTEAAVVKAYISATGYNDSDVASAEIAVKSQWATPELNITRNDDNTTIELTSTEEGAEIYFNFSGATTAITSQKYTEPIVLTIPGTLYAFVEGGEKLNSPSVVKYIGVNSYTTETARLDTLTIFDANKADWFVTVDETNAYGNEAAYYYWGKNAWNYYTTDVIATEPVLGEDGLQLKTEDGRDSVRNVYAVDPNALRTVTPATANGWVIKSAGQILTLEGNLDANAAVGNGEKGRYAETAFDAIEGSPSNSVITFGGKTSGDPYTGMIETTTAYAGPFDVVVYAGNGNSGSKPEMEIQISADGTTWTKLGDVLFADTQRYWKRTVVAYEETAAVYVRVAQTGGSSKAQIYEIRLMNNGEISKGYVDGVELPATTGAELVGVQIYNLSGAQINELGTGLNIVRQFYSDGTVKVLKVMGK